MPEPGHNVLCYIVLDNALQHHTQRTRVCIERAGDSVRNASMLAFYGSKRFTHGGIANNISAAETGFNYAWLFAHEISVERAREFNRFPKSDIHFHNATAYADRSNICSHMVRRYLRKGDTVTLYISTISKWLTLYLLRRECRRVGLDWKIMRQRVSVISCGGTLFHNVSSLRWRTPFWWFNHVVLEELHQLWLALRHKP